MAAHNAPWKKPDTTALRAQLSELIDAGEHETLLETILGLVEQMASQNDQLAWRLQTALSQLYRKKSEKVSAEQLSLFLSRLGSEKAAQAEVELDEPQNETEEEKDPAAQVPAKPRAPKTPRKNPFPAHLRREPKPIPVPQEQRTCPTCHRERQPMGYQKREIWEYRPGEFYVIEEQLEKLVCKCCQEGVVTAEGTPNRSKGVVRGPACSLKS